MAWIWTALSVLVFLYILQELLSLPKKKRLPPGPRALPIIGHLHLLGNNPQRDLYNLAQKYGPIMGLRFGVVPVVVVSSPAGAELVLKTHDLVFASRPRLAAVRHLGKEQRNLIFAPYGPYWRNMRKLITLHSLSTLKINQFQSMRKEELGLLVESLKQAAENREIVDVKAKMLAVIRDMNCLMMFGRKYDDGDLDEKGFNAVVMETLDIAVRFNLGDYFPYIGRLDLQGLNRRMKTVGEIFEGFMEKIIEDHVQNKRENKQSKDLVGTLMAIMESGEAGFEFDCRHIKAVALDLFIAALDTTARSVEWALAELIRHPQVMKKLQKELESIVGMDHMVEESHLDKLQYLYSVVKETLRLHPTAPLLVPHSSIEDCVVDGFHIPKGSLTLVNAWAIGRDPSVWPNAETFLPERFIKSDIDFRGQQFQLIPFGSGRRGCPGIQLGLKEVRLTLAQLVHCFDWELPNGMLPIDVDIFDHHDKPLLAIPRYRLPR